MRIPSGSVDRKIAFVAVDATDLKTRETGLTGFTVYRSRNGGTATVYTTPTVAELSAANMPGVYTLLVDEDTTVDAGHDVEEYVVHITQASMAPVTRALELERVKFTEGQVATMANNAVDADLERVAGATTDVSALATNVAAILVDTGTTLDARIPAALVGGRMDASVGAMAANVMTAAAAAADLTTELQSGLATAAALATVQADTDDIQSKIGTPVNLGGGATLAANLSDIEAQTDDIGAAGAGLTALGDARLANLDATVSSRLATAGYTAPPTAAVIADAVLDEDMTAHQTQGSLGQAIGDPVADTNTIYKAVVTDAVGATVGVDVVAVKAETAAILADTAEIGAAGAGLTALGDARLANLDETVSSRLATAGYTVPPTAAANADAVWDETIADHLGAGSTGAALNAAGGAGDPWATAIPGAYGSGTAGKILGDNINATISSRASQASVDAVQADTDNMQTRLPAALVSGRMDASVGAMAANVLTASALATDARDEIVDRVWDEPINEHLTFGTFGSDLQTSSGVVQAFVDAAVSSRATQASVDAVPTAAENADAVLDEDMTAHQTQGTLGQAIGDSGTGAGIIPTIDTEVGAIKTKTDQLVFTTPNRVDASAPLTVASDISADAANKIADHTLRRSYADARQSANGDALNFRSLLGAIGKLVNRWNISGSTLTVYQEDDTTATAPGGTQTVTGTPAADPITQIDTD
jgi:hypothetical protein